ncbi:hypothetical protein PFICI_14661 [Pestalotiopsis fici W106-1]|uniref:Calcineurin-like phosphoesterase domain-containing protein n=1 Tax=Pestalotiopsis fici (strain W106-1 / CGMCC3.15140) TaxID=1229662 RepID=W3WIH4_PESFW|nr:uncharacterized protein PFICI_14661 [Pestalotiopsis fici W106-1]ETS73715.1 hypothetical protein PFICI_14661 [Pestalotiopsis fici W106-1]
MAGGKSKYIEALQLLGQIEAELKLVIAGNHDLSLDPDWWQANLDDDDDPFEPDQMKKLMQSQAENGVQYLEEGTHIFKLKNGTEFSVYASPYTPEFNGYAFGYPHEEDRFNNRAAANPIPENVDIIMSHGPPRFPHDENCEPYTLDMNESSKHLGCLHLFRAIQRVRPLLHCFGHIHEGYGAQFASWEQGNALALHQVESELENGLRRLIFTEVMSRGTLLINAALKVHGSQQNNHPWILTLPLRHQTGMNI